MNTEEKRKVTRLISKFLQSSKNQKNYIRLLALFGSLLKIVEKNPQYVPHVAAALRKFADDIEGIETIEIPLYQGTIGDLIGKEK